MATKTIEKQTIIEEYENKRVYYVERSYLGGLIKSTTFLKEESLGKELMIHTTEDYDKIFLNDRQTQLYPKLKKLLKN